MLSDASAQGVGFNSPSGTDGNTIYEDQFDSGTVGAKFVVFHANRFSSWDTSKVRLQNAPTGLTIAGGRTFREFGSTRSCSYQFHRRCIEIDLGWSSTADVTTDTTVTVQVHYDMFLNKYVLSSGWNDVATFTIKAVVEELQVSTPTSSSTVTEAGSKSEFTVRLGKAPTAKVTVNVSSSDTSEGSVSPSELVFTSDDYNTTQSVTITGVDDSIYDGSQSWNVVLNPSSSDTGYNALSDVNVAMTTTDNEDAPTFSINSPSVTEGDTGSVNLTFTVTLSAASALQHQVNYADAGTGTATSGTDYTALAASSTLTFAAGETSKTITVPVTGDTAVEANETVVISLSNATGGAGIATASGTGTITDDDLKFSIDSPSVTEGDSGAVNLVFTVTLNASVSTQHTVDFADAGTGTATSGTDYTAITGSTLTFAANETSKTITVSVTGDTAQEGNETVVISLSNATGGAGIATASGTGTIIDNDITFSIDSPSVTEGDSGSVNLVFTVTLSASVSSTHTVAYADAGSGTATSGTDYTSVAGGTLTFAANETSKTVAVSVTGDTLGEGNETVVISLSNATTGISTATGTGTIRDNDLEFSIDSPSVTEGDTGSVNLVFTVTLNAAVSSTHTVDYADAGTGTATSGTDYTSISGGTLTFAANETSKMITVPVRGDTLNEGNETVVISLSNATTSISTASGTGTIRDNDLVFSIDSPSVTEGDSGSVNLVFTVTLNASVSTQQTVDYADARTGTATSGTDYTSVTGGTLTFAANETSKTITVLVTGDTTQEGNETVVIELSNATSGISTASGTGTIIDNDLTFSIDSPSVTEGDSGPVNLVFTVTLNASSTSPHTVDYVDAGTGTATSGTDYTAVTGSTLTFSAGETSKTITVSVTGDTADEGHETVAITLSNATTGISTASGTGTITDDDPKFSINSPIATEGDSSSVNLIFTVTLSASSTSPYTVDYADAGTGTATSGTDYTAVTASTLTFAPGVTTQTITVSVTGDTTDEGAGETVVISLSNASSGTAIATASGTGTITDNDPKFSINSPTATEGDSGSANLVFTVTLSAAGASPYTVDYAQTGGTATSGTDYTAVTADTLTFAAGTTTQTITVSVTGDTLDESNETVVLTLSNASSGTAISTATGTGTITDDDPKFSIDSPSVTEGDSGSVNLVYTVTLSASSSSPLTVNYADAGTGTATSGTDYTTIPNGTLTFSAGETSKTITVSVTGDTANEGNETVAITLSNATSGTGIGTATGTGTIIDNDLTFSIDSPSVTEGDSGSVNLTFTVTLSASVSSTHTVDYADAGTGTATSGTDYTSVTGSTLTFAANETSKTITVSVTGDTANEGNETVVIELSNATTSISTARGTGTITDNDLVFSIDSPSVTEGDSGSVNLIFTVTLSASSTSTHTVNYADAGSGTAASGTDYTSISGGTLTFAANETSKTIAVSVTGDTLDEGTGETVVISLSNATTGISTASGTGTITDNDPKFSINSPSVTEGDSSSVNLVFTVTLSASSTSPLTVDYADAGTGTATSGTDYTSVTGSTLTFAAGVTSQTITVQVTGDTTGEPSETVVIELSNASAGTEIATASGTGTITDNDLVFAIDSPSVTEGDSGSVNLVFTVTLSLTSASQHTVDYADAGTGTATSGSDYTSFAGGTLTFSPGETSKTVAVLVRGDTLNEGNETVVISLSNATTAISTASGTGTIRDNDLVFSIDSPSVTEGDSSSVNLVFTVTLNASSTSPQTVDYADAGTGTATSGTDYTAVTASTLTFAANETSKTITVSVTGDTANEGNETVAITLSNASTGISTASGTGTIIDNDLTFSIDSPSVTEGDSSTANLTFTVTLNASSTSPHTVDYADAGTGTATSGTDYTAVTANTLTFAPGVTTQTITVSVTGDTVDEGHETVAITLSNATTGISTASGTGTITDDDPKFSINSPTATEGDSSSASLVFTVTLSAAGASPYTVDYADAGTGTATSGTDYTAVTASTLTFAAGETSKTITVSVTGDTTDEGTGETVVISLSNASSGTAIATASGTGTIADNDPKFSINSPTATEGDSSSASLVFTVTLSAAGASPYTVDYAQTGGTATSGTDYTAVAADTLTFAAGTTSRTITVPVTGDTLDESNETVVLTLSNASAGTGIATSTGTGTITDDDPKFSIDSPSATEGDSGQANLIFTVTLSAASTSQLTVDYAQTGGTATSGTDYAAVTAGTLTFAASETTKTITVLATGDTADESNETVVLTLSNATAGTGIATSTGTGTIRDDDPKFSINSPSVTEGDSGQASLTFTVTLSASSTSQLTVDYAQTGGTATSGTDYAAVTAGTLTFAASETTQTITVLATGDTLDESSETVVLTLSNASAGTGIATATGTGTIRDDDPKFSIDSPSVTEGDSGQASLTFTVTLSASSTSQLTVDYAQTGGTATSGTDYAAVTADTLTFAASETTKTITVLATGDAADESNETVVLTLSNATAGTGIATATGTGTIRDDDPKFSIDSPSVTEGDSGPVNLVFTVTLSASSTSQLTVDYAQTGGTATSGTDYTAVAGSTLTFAPGDTSQTITVSVTGDTTGEGNETVEITLSNASAGTGISTATGTGTIRDNDLAFSIDSPSVAEGDSSSASLVFTVTLSSSSTSQHTVDYADAGSGTATSGTDYASIAGGTLTFAAGETSKTFTVSVTGDTLNEGNETIVISLSNATTGIATASGTGTIVDNDLVFSIDSPSVAEGDSSSVTMTFTVTLSASASSPHTVDYADAGTGTASSGTDYTSIAGGTLTFGAGVTSRTITVSVTGDTAIEGNETIVISLSNATTGIATASGTGTIRDDDLVFSIDSPSVAEGDSGSASLVFTVSLSTASASPHTVDYADAGSGTASSGTDYTAVAAGTLTFAANETSRTITVSVRGDTLNEGNETVVLALSNASAGTAIATSTGTGTIRDDDLVFSIDSPSVTEGDSGSVNLTFTVTLNASASSTQTVDYADAGTGTATSGTDYTAVAGGTLTFAVGTTTQTIAVSVTGDTTQEGNETVVLELSNATTGISTASGTGTITDNDLVFSIDSPSAAEGDSGQVNLTFTVTLSASVSSSHTVDYAQTGGTATSGTDYTAVAGGTLTFAATETSKTITVLVTGDTADEGNETVVIMLSNASTGISTASGTGTITDDDPKFSINSPSVAEGDSSTANLVFTVTLSGTRSSSSPLTVDYASSDGTATAGTDYTAVSGTLTFASGETSKTVAVSVAGDTTDESNETVALTLSNASAGTGIATATGTGTIRDDDPNFSINSPSVVEGDSSSADLVFTVTLSASASSPYTVDYADAGTGTATSGTDYTAVAGSTLTFAAGETSKTITVSVTGDTLDESNETVVLTLSNASSGTAISTATGTGTIRDDDPKFSINSPSVTEGDSSSVNLVFTVTLSASSTSQLAVDYAQTGGTATSGTDYAAVTAGVLTFAPGTTSRTIAVSVTGDTADESNETVVLTLSNATAGAGISTATGTGTIMDDDPKFSIGNASVAEGDSGSANLVFTVTLSASSTSQLTVDYAQTGGTATSGTDYTAVVAGTLTFPANSTTRTITVLATGDTLDEANETVVLTLSNASAGAGISTATGTGTIRDDDPKFSINSPTVTEADSNSVNLVFTVTLSASSSSQLTVDYAQTGGTATSGTDYTAVAAGTLTFAAGTTSRTITVSVTGDAANEVNETVIITLSNATAGAGIGTAVGTGTITDNDTPGFSINSPSVAEGDSSTTNLVFTVTLSPAPATAATVNWAEGTGGTATSGTDYTAIAGGTLTFSAGTATRTISVSVTGDTSHEADETVVITLSNASTGTNISTASGTGTIANDDSGLSIDSPSVTEGDSGSANLVFTVTLDPASSSQVTVNYARTGGTATSGTDFTALAASATLTFAANETSKTIAVSVTGDTINEANETVIVTLSSASGADIVTASGTGTITDDDTPRFSINSPSVVEGDSSTANLEFTVTLSPASYQATTVDYATAAAGTATAGTDFTAIAATTLTFAAGDTSKTFMVSVTGDATDEGAGETVVAALSDATGNAEIGTSSGTGTITDDDPKFSIADASATEGDTGSVNMTFTVTLSGAGASQYTVDYASSDGTATAGADYTAVSGTLTFAAGTTSRTLTVSVTGDTANEANETLTVTLSNPSAGTAIATASGTGTITDNDTPSFSINSPSVAEGDSSTTNLTFTVSLNPAPAAAATVSWAVTGGTATSGTDFTATSGGTLSFAATETSKTFTVSVTGDTTHEPDETVVVTLSNASSGTNITTATGTGTITNDDPGLSIDSPTVTEGDSGSVDLVFTVTMSPASSSQVTVNYARSGGTATSGTDFTALAASNTLTFAANETSKTITVSVTGDTVNEPDETVIVTLSSASGADIVTASGTGTITDNDTPNFSIDSPSVAEGDSSTTNLTFTVTLSPASYQPVTVDYAQTGGTATSGTDYTAVAAGMLSFAAGATSQTITVSVTGDTMYEASETVVLTLSNASSGTNIAAATGTGTIANDDQGLLIDSPSVAEGDSGTVNLAFTVTLEPAAATQVTVNYADAGGGTATSGTDYAAVGGTLTFSAGETSKTIAVSVTGDTADEPDETVVIALSNASGASIVTARGTGTIVDNDVPGFSIDSTSAAESDDEASSLTFTVTLSPASYRQVSVNYADAGTGTATSGSDYAAFGGTLTFSAGETSKTIAVSVTDDALDEPDETVVVVLSNASSGTSIATASGTGTITDNDVPGFSIDSPSVAEGDSGTVNLTFTVSLSPASHQPATVNYADAGTGTATSGTDYETLAGGTLRFAAGETSKTIAVSVTGDAEFEPDETVVVALSSATSDASISTASGTGTIENDDDTPVFSIDSPSVEEGDADSVNLTFTVTLTPASFEQATVNYADTGTGTAEAGEDYRSIAGGTLTFAAGETSKTIDVSVLGDVLSEQDETVVLVLSDPNPSYTIEEARGTGTITDNDASVLDEVDTEIVAEVAREVTTSVVAAVGNRIASVVGGAAIVPPVGLPPVTVPPTGGFADGGLLSILERSARHSRERERGLERSEMSLYRSLDGASFVYTPSVAALGANGSADASGGTLAGTPTVWGSVDYRKLSGGGADALQWDGELASVNIGTDTMVDAGVLVGLAAGVSKGSFGYQGSAGGTSGVVKVRVKSLNPYIGWSVSESASLWAAVGYGKGKVNYNDGATGEAASKMSIASAALGGRYRLHSTDGSSDGRLIQVDLKGEAWGLQTRVDGDERRPMGSKSRAHGVRVAIERLQNCALESGASLTLSGEAGLRWDGGDGDTGTGIEMGGTADYHNPATRMKLVATGRALLDHESERKEWGAGVTAGYRLNSRETGLTYRSSLSHGQTESGVDSLWDSRVASRASEDAEPTTRLDAEVGYRMFGASGLHTPYVGFGAEDSGTRDYRIGMRYASESELSSGLEFERREADNKRPDHRVMLTGQINW